jgi:mannose-1-phosphate guanylyltransferase
MNVVPVILSGGSGTRLWPLSRKLYPKQFLNLVSDNSLFQDTILRLPEKFSSPLIVCNEEHRFLVAEQLRQIKAASKGIILEPVGRNTAPAIAISAFSLLRKKQDPVMLVLSADHLIGNFKKFHQSLNIACKIANEGKLVSLGIKPVKAETGYGYIEVKSSKDSESHKIISFTEKPNLDIAKKYLNSGNYYWNSGIFLFKASKYLNELKKYDPKIYDACKKSSALESKDQDFIRINNKEFIKCPEKSIDYAVMEKTNLGVVVPFEGSWSDIGSWEALWNSKLKDKENNFIKGDVVLNNVKNSYIHSTNKLISANDLSDLIIIDTQDALLVSSKEKSQDIKYFAQKLAADKRIEADNHRKVYRPWGYYDLIDFAEGFQVKRIFVDPGAKLSLQKHRKRAEHWVIVKGTAIITRGDEVFKLKENQSTYIPKGEIHRLENCGHIPLQIIEIQTGKYLGEDDIIRIEDDYKRVIEK